MLEKVSQYSQNVEDIFEELVNKDGYRLNHVIIKPGKFFPPHPTDANVTILVIDGELTLKLAEQDPMVYTKGSVLQVDKGTMSELGNNSSKVTEVFVVKS